MLILLEPVHEFADTITGPAQHVVAAVTPSAADAALAPSLPANPAREHLRWAAPYKWVDAYVACESE